MLQFDTVESRYSLTSNTGYSRVFLLMGTMNSVARPKNNVSSCQKFILGGAFFREVEISSKLTDLQTSRLGLRKVLANSKQINVFRWDAFHFVEALYILLRRMCPDS